MQLPSAERSIPPQWGIEHQTTLNAESMHARAAETTEPPQQLTAAYRSLLYMCKPKPVLSVGCNSHAAVAA